MSEGPWVDSDRAEPALSVGKSVTLLAGRREGQGLPVWQLPWRLVYLSQTPFSLSDRQE